MRWLPFVAAAGAAVPWLSVLLAGSAHPGALLTATLSGVAILGAAFLLSWACEVAEMDVPKALAVSVLALVAVLPEYAVDATFAWNAAHDPKQAPYAIANMTGGNRLLLGLGWTSLLLLVVLRTRKREIVLAPDAGADVAILLVASMYAMVPVLRGALTLVDTLVYVSLYLLYIVASARGGEHGEAEIVVGPAGALAELPVGARRAGVLALLGFGAAAIFVSAEPFAESLVETGLHLGIDEFVLVQWVAPFASESPEVVVCVLMVLKGHPSTGLRMLVSSNVNQWTLLVGTLAAVYSLGTAVPAWTAATGLPMDGRQQAEVLLTAAQCLFALVAIADLSFALWQGLVLAGLFLVQIVFLHAHAQVGMAYLVLALGVLIADGRSRAGVLNSFVTLGRMVRGRGAEPASD